MSTKILDCTLRDGGYYNNWDFKKDLVKEYLEAMAVSKTDFIELGLRQFKNESFLGAHAYTTNDYLNRLDLPKGPKYGVMVDAKTILSEDRPHAESIDLLFKEAKNEKISLVRVAAHFKEVDACHEMLTRLKEKGFIVGLNIMQASLRSTHEIQELSKKISSWDCIDVVYYADSLGSMSQNDIEEVYRAIAKHWKKDIGFHSHNNMGQALTNVNAALDIGCNWIDGTVTGMGRGAGNAATEYLFLEKRIKRDDYDPSPLFNLVKNHFLEMKRECGWGASIPYYIGALNNVHPTYVQELCKDTTINEEFIPKIIQDLGQLQNPNSFNQEKLERVKSKTSKDMDIDLIEGESISDFMQNKKVLIVAQTESSLSFKEAIHDYIKKKKPIVVSINQPKQDLDIDYDFVFITHNEKFREDENKYKKDKNNFIAPKKLFNNSSLNIAYDYGIQISENRFEYNETYACIPFRITVAYAIAFCMQAKASEINLVGFGGFDLNDPRQKEMQEFLSILSKNKINLFSLTPTTFTIKEKSIYAI